MFIFPEVSGLVLSQNLGTLENLVRSHQVLVLVSSLNCDDETQYGALISQVLLINNNSLHICLSGICYGLAGGMAKMDSSILNNTAAVEVTAIYHHLKVPLCYKIRSVFCIFKQIE